MDLSVVIPAFNEERFIADTVNSITSRVPPRYGCEVIVVDHGSTDRTVDLARSAGATVIDGSGVKTIAALRNLGVGQATGRILVFIDADITLTPAWTDNIGGVVESLDREPRQICGSHPGMPETASPLVRRWFEPKAMEVAPTHIGSCHLIITRSLFAEIGGFPEDQETSEEFLLCHRARKAGARIVGVPALAITHHGAPRTLGEFMKSETWHGRGDWNSVSSILSSRVALLSLLFMALHALLLVSLFFVGSRPMLPLLPLLAIGLMCAGSAFMKFAGHGMSYVVANTFTFYFYFVARSLSLASALRSPDIAKRSRAK
jgi:glycosyltransferase involved in cell wall biosynthesis